MDIIKTIYKLSFFVLGCVMLVIALLVIPVGFNSFIWFFCFSFLFYLLSFQYTLAVIKWVFQKIINIFKSTKTGGWKNLTIENISYDESLGLIKLNSKTLSFDQIVSVDIIANSKKVKASELNKISDVKKLEIKIGTQVKKVVYRHFKYITGKISEKNKKIAIKSCLKDYKKLKKVLKNVKFD